ncbi:hypothetical protein RHSIM_Rhsim08G0139400 [Rhododendron simsii]|uniref:Protein FAR1-RELATED SEQUENCE n=1 Tax=Rhododendron simsii TaxID=118357 RepID=A0A834GQ43_RHOSS|nr:hypothetical protein RHSIM_Rhsim08G0139400 [Rhododendron simsii]
MCGSSALGGCYFFADGCDGRVWSPDQMVRWKLLGCGFGCCGLFLFFGIYLGGIPLCLGSAGAPLLGGATTGSAPWWWVWSAPASGGSEGGGEFLGEIYTPQVKNEVIPKIDQQFLKLDDVWKFHNDYAREAGFSVQINSRRLGENDKVMRKEYVCFKEGERRSSKATKRRRGLTRERCGAKLAVVRKGEVFVVSKFVEGHNHEITMPRKVHLLKSHRQVLAAQKVLTQQLSAANMPTYQQMSIFELQAGGIEDVGFLPRDLYNVKRDRKNVVHGHDANILYEHLEVEQQKNPGFRFTFETDDKDRMTHCFWADATSRKSYQYFGDVVVFDTTYYTSKYSLIFAPILGVNHHRQTTLLGCAFLSDEKADLFVWLFNEWLKAMPGGPPKMIITDQDPAMTRAIASALPNTMQIRELPTEYILQRWTKIAKAGRVMDDLGSGVKEICNSSVLVRRQGLFQLACTVIDDAVLDEEESEVVREALESSQKKIALMRSSRKDGSTSRGKEKAVKKRRKCNGCGLTGSSQDVMLSDDEDDDGDDVYDECNLAALNDSSLAPSSSNWQLLKMGILEFAG